MQMLVQIIPSLLRSEDDRMEPVAPRRDILDFDNLPQVIAEAGALMGVRGFDGTVGGPTLARDILQITVWPNRPLSPRRGLIAVANEE